MVICWEGLCKLWSETKLKEVAAIVGGLGAFAGNISLWRRWQAHVTWMNLFLDGSMKMPWSGVKNLEMAVDFGTQMWTNLSRLVS
jgi:hypothetical protein